MNFILEKSRAKGKKYRAVFISDGKIINFGASGYSDYTLHKDKERKKRYISRHKKREDWRDIRTAGALSRWILWNKPSLDASIKDTEKRFNINIINNI